MRLRGYQKGGRGFWLGTPSSFGPPVVPAEGGLKTFEAEILLALKAPKQNFGCQPQTLEGGEEGVTPLLDSSYRVRPF